MAPDTDVLPKPATTKIEPTTSTAADGSTKTKRRSMSVTSLREGVHIIPNEAEMKEATSVVRNPSPWRELDSDAFVIAYSMKGTAKCGACLSKVAKGELQLGTFYTHEDKFTLVKWHHQRCVVAPKCLTHPVDLCGIEDLKGEDLDRVMNWLGFGPTGSGKDRSWTA